MWILMLICGAMPVLASTPEAKQDIQVPEVEAETMRAEVLEVSPADEQEPGFTSKSVTLEIYSGSMAGEVLVIDHYLSDHPVYDIPVEPGDRVLVEKDGNGVEATEMYIVDYVRDETMGWVLGLFLFLVVLVGRWKGVKTILTLGITFFLIVRVLLPALLAGHSPVLLTVGISFAITLLTILILNGWNIKSASAITGVFGGLLVAGLVMGLTGSRLHLTGLSSEEAVMLMYIPQEVSFNFRDLLFAGIILGALGAVMDVGVSIASSMHELVRVNPDISSRELIRSGMNIGRDIMTTMSNTLILAYTGAALPLLLLFMAYEASLVEMINLDMIATEIIRALSGSIGLILTIPLTVLTSTVLFRRYNNQTILPRR